MVIIPLLAICLKYLSEKKPSSFLGVTHKC